MMYKNPIFILIIFLTISCSKPALLTTHMSSLFRVSHKKAWCWTKYTPGVIKSVNGGNNWGFCKSIKKIRKKVKFNIFISTSTIPGSATKSNLYIKLKGEEGLSSETLLSNEGLAEGSYIKKEIVIEDVGSLKAIQLRIEENNTYRCNTLRVEYQQKYWNFECDSELISCPICKEEIKLTNLISYDLTVKTRDLEDASTLENIYIRIIGENGKTPEKLMSNRGFSRGSIVNVSIDSVAVGLITGISLSMKTNDNWMPEYLIIRYLRKIINNKDSSGYQEQLFTFPQNAILNDLDKPLVVNLGSNRSKNKSKKKKPIFDNEITIKGNDNFGPSYVTQQINFQNYIAYCPYNCYQMKVRTIGLGIHPEEAPICISALVDRAISFYGGYISLSILNGIDSYTGGKKILGFNVLPFGSSMRSFTVTKINNVDLIASDVRIIDFEGKPSYIGRLEMRFQGVWGTVCAQGLDTQTANVICKEQGYKRGKFLNPPPNNGRKFCTNFNGMNYCGAPQSRVFYSKIRCQGNEFSVYDCYREMADPSFCTHDYDTLIQCANSTADESVYYENGTVKLLNHKNENPEDGRGRLKIFMNGKWGTICNKGFTDLSARVACRQMGFISGKILKDSENRIIDCQNVFGNNMCGDLLTPILLKSVDCEDKKLDQKLLNCPHDLITSSCTHFNDIILQCEGFGDTTGRSQNMKPQKVLKPEYKPLPLLPKYSAKCDSNAYQMTFRGDPGSLFLVSCPKGCTDKHAGLVFGSSIYALGSSICRAAIHAGAITDEGGNFILVKTYGQNSYQKGNFRGVLSINSNKRLSSFFISKSLKVFEALSEMLNAASFLEVDIKTNYNSSQILGKLKPYFEWISTSNYIFDSEKNTFISLNHNQNLAEIPFLTKFTIYTKVEMTKFADKVQTIFSIGGCNGYSLSINDQTELIVDSFCGKRIYYSGLYVPINHFMNISFSYDSKKIIFYLNNRKLRELPADLKIDYPRFIYSIGGSSENSIDIFNGKIVYVKIYNVLFEENNMNAIPQLRLGGQNGNKLTTLNKSYDNHTVDSRICISNCMKAPIPGTEGSPDEPYEALKPDQILNKEVNNDNSEDNKGTDNDNKLGEIFLLKCNTRASDIFKNSITKKVRAKCPTGCIKFDSKIFGNIIYSDKSSICKAAIHSGILSKVGGVFFVRKKEPLSLYVSKKKNGIQSYPNNSANFSFQIEEAPKIIIIACNTLANNDKFPEIIGLKFLVKCPGNCDSNHSNIYGNNVYSNNSSICKSAIHSGIMTKEGGEITFMIIPGKKSYLGITKFGIKSLDGKETKSAIRFFVSKTVSFIKYKELFLKGSLLNNWKVIDSNNALNGPSNWKIVPTKFATKSKFIINQSSNIRLSNKPENTLNFASILLLKDAEFVNCFFRTFLYLENSNPLGIILKYVDEMNYYSVILNNPAPYPMVFIKKQKGKTIILSMSRISLKLNVFYIFSVEIYLGDDHNIKVFLEFSDKKIHHLLFNIRDSAPITKGGIGFATNGNSNFFITNILIDNFSPPKSNKIQVIEKRTFEQILQENTESGREKFCKGIFHQIDRLYLCMEAHNFCQLKCNESIPKRENVLNYHCYKSCVKDSKSKVINTSNLNEENQQENRIKDLWSPKVMEKCDYKPEEIDNVWIPCLILKVKKFDNLNETVFIRYKVKNKIKTINIIFPSPNLVKCGVKIKSRKDCIK